MGVLSREIVVICSKIETVWSKLFEISEKRVLVLIRVLERQYQEKVTFIIHRNIACVCSKIRICTSMSEFARAWFLKLVCESHVNAERKKIYEWRMH